MNRVYERRRLGKHEFCLSKAKHTGVNRNFIPNCLRVRLSSKSFFRCFSLLFPLCVQKNFNELRQDHETLDSHKKILCNNNNHNRVEFEWENIIQNRRNFIDLCREYIGKKSTWNIGWKIKKTSMTRKTATATRSEEWGGELVDGGWHIFFYFKFYVHDTIWGSSAILRERNLFHINRRRRTKRDDVIFSSIQKVETRWQFKGGCR